MKAHLYCDGDVRSLEDTDWPAMIGERDYAALIFDCDGTLVESEDAQFRAFELALAAQGLRIDRDWYFGQTGLDRLGLLRRFAEQTGTPLNVERCAADSIAAYVAATEPLDPIAPVVAVAHRYRALPRMVGTNAETEVAAATLARAGIADLFDGVVALALGLAPKPAPDIFAEAARRMAVDPSRTLVIEDSPQGRDAGRAAGMDVLLLVK